MCDSVGSRTSRLRAALVQSSVQDAQVCCAGREARAADCRAVIRSSLRWMCITTCWYGHVAERYEVPLTRFEILLLKACCLQTRCSGPCQH